MVRVLALLLLTSVPAAAWEATSGPVCELSYQDETTSVQVTYDPSILEYALSISPMAGWVNSPVFVMRFDGPEGNTIATDRHVLSEGGATLTVTDRGFGNVLNGLEFNTSATALLGEQAVSVPLEGAAPAVQAFRACASSISV